MRHVIFLSAVVALLAGCVDAPADLYGVHRATPERTTTTGQVAHYATSQGIPSARK